MINVNTVTLIGKISCSPVFDSTKDGTPVSKFLLVTEDQFKDTKRNSTHHISVIGKSLCDIIKSRATVGKTVMIRGRLEYWADDKKNRLVDVRAEYVQFET